MKKILCIIGLHDWYIDSTSAHLHRADWIGWLMSNSFNWKCARCGRTENAPGEFAR